MNFISFLATAVALVSASPFPGHELDARDCTANNCLRAIRGSPEDVANMFCSSALGKSAATDTQTSTATITVTAYTTVVSTATTHVVTGTVTVTPEVAQLAKRKTTAYSEYTSKFTSMCSYSEPKITSACSCYLADVPTSTITVYETVSETLTQTTSTSTSATTVTVDDIATVTYVCTPNPTNAIQNGDFEAGGSQSPWQVVDVEGRATYSFITDAANGDATTVFHSKLQHVGSSSYTGLVLQQTIDTCPGVYYVVTWYIRATGDQTNSYAYVFINGEIIQAINGLPQTSYGEYQSWFTASEYQTVIGFKALEAGGASGHFYFDNISIAPVSTQGESQ